MKHTIAGYFFLMALLCVALAWYSSSHSSQFSPAFSNSSKQVMGEQTSKTQPLVHVVKVLDGKTIVTDKNDTISYIGLHVGTNNEPYGKEATDFNTHLVLGKDIHVTFDTQKKDAEGRLLGYVYVGNTFVNEELLTHGWASMEITSPNTEFAAQFENAQKNAQRTCQGLWSDSCIPQSKSCLAITAIHQTSDVAQEFVTITNSCSAVVDLSGWLIKDKSAINSYTFGKNSLQPSHSLYLHSGCGTDTSTDIYWQCPSKTSPIWTGSGASAMLFDNYGKLLSVYSY